MKLAIFKRETLKKGDTKRLRREGNIPAVLYGASQSNENVYLKNDEMQAILRGLKSGLLATAVFELVDGKKTHKAVIKDVQYHVTSYAIQHIDFAILSDNAPVSVNVPIQILGSAECAGVKLGGFPRQVIRTLRVSCLPKDIPQEFTLDITSLDVNQSKRLSDIAIPANVRPLAKMSEVAVMIGKKAGAVSA